MVLRSTLRYVGIVFFLLVSCPALTAAVQKSNKPLNKKAQTQLVEEYINLDLRANQDYLRSLEIIDRLESVVLPRAGDLKKWRKNLAKMDRKMHRLLEKKSGRHYWWEESRRGLFLVSGNTKKPKGLLLGMHGGGAGSGDANESASAYSSAASALDWLAIFPEVLEKTDCGWTDSGTEEWVLDLIDSAIRTWKIDPNMVFLAGHSMGGYGSWTLGGHHADRVAALAPSAGAPTPVYDKPGGVIVEIDTGIVPNLRNIPMVVFQSTNDPQVPADANQAAVKEVAIAQQRWGGYENFDYWEVHQGGHAYPPGGMRAHLKRISDFVRNPVPEKVVWQPRLDWKHQFYWLYWEKPIADAIVVVELDRDANTIRIQCDQELQGFWVLLDERLVDMKKEVVLEFNGEESHRAIPQATLGALLLTTAGPDSELSFPARLALHPPPK